MREGLGCARRLALLPAAVALAIVLAACDQGQPQASQPKAPPPAPAVTVSKPAQRQIVEWDEYTGRFDAVQMVEIRTRVSGYLNEVRFKDGQQVQQGDILFIIDQRPFERALEQARAELFAATTKIENANLDVQRGQPLIERKIISDKVFDDRMNLLRDAQASMKVAESKVKSAELDLSFATIASPISGRIGRALVTAGNWISAGSVAGTTLLTTIVSQDPIYVYFDVNENNYIKYKRLAERGVGAGAAAVGAQVEVALADERGFPHKGQLDFLDNRMDQGTGTLRARAILPNKAGLFSPGLFGARARDGLAELRGAAGAGRGHRHRSDQQVRVRGRQRRHGGAAQRGAGAAGRRPARGARGRDGRGLGDHQRPAAGAPRPQGRPQAHGDRRDQGAGRRPQGQRMISSLRAASAPT